MARLPVNYWEKRSTELMLNAENETKETINDLIKIYEQATKNINEEIKKVFKNYGKDNVLNKEALSVMLNKKETEIHYQNLLKTINVVKDPKIKKKLIAKYNAPAYNYRITRLQELQDNIDKYMYQVANLEQQITELKYVNTVERTYNYTVFNIQKGTHYGFEFSQLDNKTINLLLNNKWSGNQNYSKSIWRNVEELSNYLKINLTSSMLTGKSVNKISKETDEYMNVGKYNATRLVRTEINHFANEAEAFAYQECGISKYKFIATLDNRTCGKCGQLDNKVFELQDKKIGVNFPPIHPNDRCTTVAYFEDEEENIQRRAKDGNGNTILIPENIDFKNWAMQYAPEIYKKYYINIDLPKTKPSEDSYLNKQIAFYEDNKKLNFIPKNAIINNVHIIAGNGTQTVFRSANKYSRDHGGIPEEWTKKVGKIESQKYMFDVHWVEHYRYGKFDFKLKGKKLK